MKTLGTGSIHRNDAERPSAADRHPEAAVQHLGSLAHAFDLLRSSGIELGLWRVRIDGVDTHTAETMVADALGRLGATTSLPGGDVIFLQFSGLFRARRPRSGARWHPYLVVGMIAERLERLCGRGDGARAVVTFRAVRADEFPSATALLGALDSPPAQSVTIDMPGHGKEPDRLLVCDVTATGMVAANDVAARPMDGGDRLLAAGGR